VWAVQPAAAQPTPTPYLDEPPQAASSPEELLGANHCVAIHSISSIVERNSVHAAHYVQREDSPRHRDPGQSELRWQYYH